MEEIVVFYRKSILFYILKVKKMNFKHFKSKVKD